MAQNEMENPTYQQEQSSPCPLKWTIMIYLAGDNNLSANSINIMQELEAAASRPDVRVLACFDSNTPRPKGARYLEINHRRHTTHTGMNWGLHNDLVPLELTGGHPVVAPDFCNTNPSTIKIPAEPIAQEGLSRFLEFALKHHRAERHLLIVFGHGTAVAGNTFLADSNPPSFLRLKDFAKVLAKHFSKDENDCKPKLDILACHNCVMNGIEAAYQVREQVDYVLGSQGLVLADGWPYRKIINAVINTLEEKPNVGPPTIALKILKVCARDLLDFSLMDRSSEQAVCDLTKFGGHKNIVTAVKKLACKLQEGLAPDDEGKLCFPEIADAVRLARLQAQSYWSETFVDLYDFCHLLARECNKIIKKPVDMVFDYQEEFRNLFSAKLAAQESQDAEEVSKTEIKQFLVDKDKLMKLVKEISDCCKEVLQEIKGPARRDKEDKGRGKKFVLESYYVGPALQYSNGVSIYFPWTLPEEPLFFEPVQGQPGNGSGGYSYSASARFNSGNEPPTDFELRTPFDEYKDYDFAKCDAGDWAAFLDRFFRATLRDVRRFEFSYEDSERGNKFIDFDRIPERTELPPVNLRKSSSDADSEEDCTCPTIKNYPRRFYISPADCQRRDDLQPRDSTEHTDCKNPLVSYLGWNVRGLVAEAIGLPPCQDDSDPHAATDESSETEIES